MKRTALKLLIATFVLTSGSICVSAAEQEANASYQNEQVALIGDSNQTIEETSNDTLTDSNSANTETTSSDENLPKTEEAITTEETSNATPADSNSSNTETIASDENQPKVEEPTTAETTSNTTPTDSNSSSTETTVSDENQPKVEEPTTTETTTNSEYSGIADLGNISLDKSTYINLNTMTYGQIKTAGEQRWYLTQVEKGKKLTVFLGSKSESAIDLNVYLFKFNESTGTVSQVAYSALNGKSSLSNEQLSYISDGGYYFICVNSADGFDVNNKYQVILISSDKYDLAEADDSIAQRKIISGIPTTVSQTIDNAFDVDWIQFTVPENKNISGILQNTSSNGTYKMTVYDSNLNILGTLSQGQNFNGLFAAGSYLIKVEPISGCDTDIPYTITFTPYDNFSTRKAVSGFGTITDSISNALDENWLEYSLNSTQKIAFNLTNPDSQTQYALDICSKNSDGNLTLLATINQGNPKNLILNGGTYYFRVRSVNGYNPNTQYTLSFTVDPYTLCSSGNYVVTTNSSYNELYINGNRISMSYIPSSVYFVDGSPIVNGQRVYGDASSHVDSNTNSRITNYGIVTYSGKTCVCVEVTNISVYTWRYINGSSHMEYLNVPLGQFVVDLETGQCIDGGVLQWY